MKRLDTPKSSNIKAVEYDEADRALYVIFKGGTRYKYEDVPEEIFNSFGKVASVGKYFRLAVKDLYKCLKC